MKFSTDVQHVCQMSLLSLILRGQGKRSGPFWRVFLPERPRFRDIKRKHNCPLHYTDVDECAMNNGGCSEFATCTNIPDSFICICNHGYTGDGFICTGTITCDNRAF